MNAIIKGAEIFNIINACSADRKILKDNKCTRTNLIELVAQEKSENAWKSTICIRKAASPSRVDYSMQVHGSHLILPDSRSS